MEQVSDLPNVRFYTANEDIQAGGLATMGIDTDRLATIHDVALQQVPLERRVVAAIVGMPEE